MLQAFSESLWCIIEVEELALKEVNPSDKVGFFNHGFLGGSGEKDFHGNSRLRCKDGCIQFRLRGWIMFRRNYELWWWNLWSHRFCLQKNSANICQVYVFLHFNRFVRGKFEQKPFHPVWKYCIDFFQDTFISGSFPAILFNNTVLFYKGYSVRFLGR